MSAIHATSPDASDFSERGFASLLTKLLTMGNELSRSESLDELCRRAVELGRQRLGFERLSIWFLQPADAGGWEIVGTFGTDEQGRTRDERGQRLPLSRKTEEVVAHRHPVTIFEPHARLSDHHGRQVGVGMGVRASIWDGKEIIGFLVADNLLNHRPIQERDRELLRLYAASLGHLCSRKRAEDAWQRSEARIRQVVESLPVIMTSVEAGTHRHVLMVGPVQHLLGYPPEFFLESPDFIASIIHPDDQNRVFYHYQEGLRSREPFELEFRVRHGQDGRDVWLHQRIVPVCDGNGTLLRQDGVTIDITSRKQAEELASRRQTELAHVARLGMVGEMAAGLAHELNQPLTAIANYTRSCARRLKGGETGMAILEDLECASAQAERAGHIIQRMRAFVRKSEQQRRPERIEKVIREIVVLTEPEMRRRDLVLKLNFEDNLPAVCVDRVAIQQVLLNLLRNGWEAMAGTGRREADILVQRNGRERIEVRVTDAGHGASPEQMKQMFEPFYTTKPEGMGLGLALSRSLIEAHGGDIRAESNRTHGLTVMFRLPVIDDEVS